jgi:hypothetical protein
MYVSWHFSKSNNHFAVLQWKVGLYAMYASWHFSKKCSDFEMKSRSWRVGTYPWCLLALLKNNEQFSYFVVKSRSWRGGHISVMHVSWHFSKSYKSVVILHWIRSWRGWHIIRDLRISSLDYSNKKYSIHFAWRHIKHDVAVFAHV